MENTYFISGPSYYCDRSITILNQSINYEVYCLISYLLHPERLNLHIDLSDEIFAPVTDIYYRDGYGSGLSRTIFCYK